jgi:molybdopterin/thiamine biosynthesis adenylyltransferase
VGRAKVEAAAVRLQREYGAAITACRERLSAQNADRLVTGADLVLDGCDDPATKFLLNRTCLAHSVPLVYGGVARTGGQWMLIDPARSACLECVFPAAGSETAQGCSALGILAPVAGVVGTMQAMAALAFLEGSARARAGSLFVYELAGVRMRRIDFRIRRDCPREHPAQASRATGPMGTRPS